MLQRPYNYRTFAIQFPGEGRVTEAELDAQGVVHRLSQTELAEIAAQGILPPE